MTPGRRIPRVRRMTLERTVTTRQAAVVYAADADEADTLAARPDIEWSTLSIDITAPAVTATRED